MPLILLFWYDFLRLFIDLIVGFSRWIRSKYFSLFVWISNINTDWSLSLLSAIFVWFLINCASAWAWLNGISWWRSFFTLLLVIKRFFLPWAFLYFSRFGWLRFLLWSRRRKFLLRLWGRRFNRLFLSWNRRHLLFWNLRFSLRLWWILLFHNSRFVHLLFLDLNVLLWFKCICINRIFLYIDLLYLLLWFCLLYLLRLRLYLYIRFNLISRSVNILDLIFYRFVKLWIFLINFFLLMFLFSFHLILILSWWNSVNNMVLLFNVLFIKFFNFIKYFIVFTSWNLLNS